MFNLFRRRKAVHNPYAKLREHALSVGPSGIGIDASIAGSPVWGILMEMGFPNGQALLVALADGTSSMYFSGGGDVIGGHAHENVRRAAAAFLATANQLHEVLTPTQASPSPEAGSIAFFARTGAGLLTAKAEDSELKTGTHALSPLFISGHMLIAELRKLTQTK